MRLWQGVPVAKLSVRLGIWCSSPHAWSLWDLRPGVPGSSHTIHPKKAMTMIAMVLVLVLVHSTVVIVATTAARYKTRQPQLPLVHKLSLYCFLLPQRLLLLLYGTTNHHILSYASSWIRGLDNHCYWWWWEWECCCCWCWCLWDPIATESDADWQALISTATFTTTTAAMAGTAAWTPSYHDYTKLLVSCLVRIPLWQQLLPTETWDS